MSTYSPAERIRANIQDLFQANLAPGDPYIRFKLTSDITALLSMDRVQNSIIIDADKITPIPGMPESVIGIMSSRDRVFCVFDLARLLEITSETVARRQYQILILQTDIEPHVNIGLAVTELQGILRKTSAEIQSVPSNVNASLTPYLKGAVIEQQEIIPILEFDYILQTLTTAKQ